MDVSVLTGVSMLVLILAWWWRSDRKYRLPPSPYYTLPIIGDVIQLMRMKKKAAETFFDLSKTTRYNKLFMIQIGDKRTLVLNDIDVVTEALVKKSVDFAGRPNIYTMQLITRGGKDIVFAPYSRVWMFHRKVAHTALRNFATGKKLEDIIMSSMQQVFTRLEAEVNTPFNIRPLLFLIVFNIASAIAYGVELDFDDPRFQQFVNMTTDFTKVMASGLPADFIAWLRFFPSSKEKEIVKMMKKFMDYMDDQLKERHNNFQSGRLQNFTDHMISVQKEAEEEDTEMKGALTDTHLLLTTMDLIGASIDTITTTLHYFVAFMAQNPDIQTKMQEELDSVLGGRTPTVNDRAKLVYTQACLRETMRCGTITGLGIPVATTCDTTIAGYDIPKDTMVLINTWALHNDPAHWPDPARFLPSRFLTPAGELAPAPRSFLPFSAGKRACLGEALAKAELMLVIPLLWQRFSFQPKPGCQLEIELEDSSLINLPKPYDVVAVARA